MAAIENGVVTNIFEVTPGKETQFPSAVCVGNRPVSAGDAYTDGKFYRNGHECKTDAELLAELLAQPDAAAEAMAILRGEEVSADGAE